MQALILAGGKGTRLAPLTATTPKPIVPIGNKTLLETQIELLKKAGIRDIILSLSYQHLLIREVMGDGSNFGVRLNYLVESQPRGTAGAFKFAEQFIDSTIIVLNGDILTDLDLGLIVKQHREFGSAATIALTKVENPQAYGLVEVDENNRVLKFLEKPEINYKEKTKNNTINAGVYILEPEILEYVPKEENCSFEYSLFPKLLRQEEICHSYVMQNDYWIDVGTPERYLQAHYDLIEGKVKNFQIDRNRKFKASAGVKIDDKSVIDENCVIKPGAKIINSVLGKNVFIAENVIIQNSVIWSDTEINSGANVSDSIIGHSCSVGKNIILRKGAILGNKTVLI